MTLEPQHTQGHQTATGRGNGWQLQGCAECGIIRADDIVIEILLQFIHCTYFVEEYCSERRFGMYANSEVLLFFNGFASGNRILRDKYHWPWCVRWATNDQQSDSILFRFSPCNSLMFRVERLQLLNKVKFANKVYGDVEEPRAQCLDGTRTEAIEPTLRWLSMRIAPTRGNTLVECRTPLRVSCGSVVWQVGEIPNLALSSSPLAHAQTPWFALLLTTKTDKR